MKNLILKLLGLFMFSGGVSLIVFVSPLDYTYIAAIVSGLLYIILDAMLKTRNRPSKKLPPKNKRKKIMNEKQIYVRERDIINKAFINLDINCKIVKNTDVILTPYSVIYKITKAYQENVKKVKSNLDNLKIEIFRFRSNMGIEDEINIVFLDLQMIFVLPRIKPSPLHFHERGNAEPFNCILGKYYTTKRAKQLTLDITGNNSFTQLVGGTSGSGKTNLISSMILSCCENTEPDVLDIYIIDINQKNFSNFVDLPHVKGYASNIEGALLLLKTVEGMLTSSRINSGNRVWIIIDEIQHLTNNENKETSREFVRLLSLIASNGRQYKVSCLLSTQHPTHSVIDTQIRNNLQVRIAGRVKTNSQSNIILGDGETSAIELSQTGSFIYVDDTKKILFYSLFLDFGVAENIINSIKEYYAEYKNNTEIFDSNNESESLIPSSVLEVFEQYWDGNKIKKGFQTKAIKAYANEINKSHTGDNYERFKKSILEWAEIYTKENS